MKIFFMLAIVFYSLQGHAQLGEAEQLLINVEKLSQLRQMLQNMYDGYQVLFSSYTTIRDLAAGNFSLHKLYLDKLLEVSPGVKSYKKISSIISVQYTIMKAGKNAWSQWVRSPDFSANELSYIQKVYQNLQVKATQNLQELSLILTSGVLRMNDDERLKAIDRIYDQSKESLSFLQSFTNTTALLAKQRSQQSLETRRLKQLHTPH